MTSAMVCMDRPATMMMSGSSATSPTATPTGNMCVVPRCTLKFEKCAGGMKITCSCDDEVACGALQNLCKMMAGGACSCCCLWNGTCVCVCNLCCGHCKCEMTEDGCCLTCTSGDKACCEMLQSCCDCLAACCKAGCQCCVSMGGTPVCCC